MLFPDHWTPGSPPPLAARVISYASLFPLPLIALTAYYIQAFLCYGIVFICCLMFAILHQIAFLRFRNAQTHRHAAKAWKLTAWCFAVTTVLGIILALLHNLLLPSLPGLLASLTLTTLAIATLKSNTILRQHARLAVYDRATRCSHCNYDLRLTPDPEGPQSPKCPECGHHFSP